MAKRPLVLTACLLLGCAAVNAKDKSGGNYGAINIGPTGILGYFKNGSPHFTVIDVAKGSPAAGKLVPNDVIVSVNGRELDGYPVKGADKLWIDKKGSRYVLGAAVTTAEATDGVLRFGMASVSSSKSAEVKIPVLGAYSPTWPVNCRKSDAIVKSIAAFLRSIQNEEGTFEFPSVELPKGVSGYGKNSIGYMMAGLFLLSTGEDEDLEAARKFAATVGGAGGTQSWYLGYRGLFLGEYYLRTGDETAKAKLAEICAVLAAHDKVGSWAHHIDNTSAGYVRGGLMNQAGINCFKAYLLARECGIDVDEAAFLRTLHFFYKFAGKGSTPYGDHRPRVNGNANGKGPSTVCTYILMEDERAARAAQLGAITGVDTFAGFEGGHTGNGFNIMWRGIAAAHVPSAFDDRRQRFMNAMTWYYDLARGHDGSVRFMPVPQGESRYASTCWGTGAMGLHYTAHRRTLRITGKPRGIFNAKPTLPPDELWRWYEQPDTDFLKVDFCEGGKELRSGIAEYDRMTTPTVEECEIMMRHYDRYIRKSFANKLSLITQEDGAIDPKALDAIERAFKHPDERVQRAATEALSGQHPWFALRQTKSLVTPETIGKRFAPYLVKILKDPKADIWLKDGALWALARADGTTLMEHLDLIESFDNHRIWWLRQSARARVHGLARAQMVNLKTIMAIIEAKRTEGRAFPTTDLTFHMQDAMAGSKLNGEQQAYIIRAILKERMAGGPPPDRKDDYGYPPPPERIPGDSSGFYPLIQGVPSEQYIQTYPLLLATIERWGDPDDPNPVTPQFGMMFYGVKRFRGIMDVLMRLGEKSRPVMQRLKKFLHTDECAAGRAKFMPEANLGAKAKRYDPYIERLRKSVTQWEKEFGKLDVAKLQRVGKTYTPYVYVPPAGTTEAPTERPVEETRDVTWTGTLQEKRQEIKRKDKTEVRVSYYLKVGEGEYQVPHESLCRLPVAYRELLGWQVELACKVTEQTDRKKGTYLRVREIASLKVLSEPEQRLAPVAPGS